MVVLNKIYTKTGDKGETSLGNGQRVPKYSMRIEAIGAVDEANSFLGLIRLVNIPEDLLTAVEHIQNDLFDLGADLCTPHTDEDLGYEPLRITGTQVIWLERQIDSLNSRLQPLRSFILPGGSIASTYAHLVRSTARRAERHVAELMEKEQVNQHAFTYLNRLSDYMFVFARTLNDRGASDILWVAGKNR